MQKLDGGVVFDAKSQSSSEYLPNRGVFLAGMLGKDRGDGFGFYFGRIDGIWGPSMQASLQRLQQGRGLPATGQLNPATVTALGLDPNNPASPAATIAPVG